MPQQNKRPLKNKTIWEKNNTQKETGVTTWA